MNDHDPEIKRAAGPDFSYRYLSAADKQTENVLRPNRAKNGDKTGEDKGGRQRAPNHLARPVLLFRAKVLSDHGGGCRVHALNEHLTER